MSAIEDIESREDLPDGFHDARIISVSVHWPKRCAEFIIDVEISNDPYLLRRGKLSIRELVYISIEPPQLDSGRYSPTPADGLWALPCAPPVLGNRYPQPPKGKFVYQFFINNWNASISVCAADALFEWES